MAISSMVSLLSNAVTDESLLKEFAALYREYAELAGVSKSPGKEEADRTVSTWSPDFQCRAARAASALILEQEGEHRS